MTSDEVADREYSARAVRARLAQLNAKGALDASVLETLTVDEGLAPIECEILDYKRDFGESKEALAKRVRDVVAMYNTYGGYLLFGVEEVQRDLAYRPLAEGKPAVDIARLKALIRLYTARRVDINYREIPVKLRRSTFTVGVLHVPKRARDEAPAAFGKPGPIDGKVNIFTQDAIYFRVQDTSCPARSNENHWFLASSRLDPALAESQPEISPLQKLITDENLPDRNFICPDFVGRKMELFRLWNWLADEFQFAKVLAGDGGKGKSSIAYKFAEEVCRTKAYGFEKIIWLTAKTKQFRGLKDDWDVVPETHFRNFSELLVALCGQLAILPEEISESSEHFLLQQLKSAFDEIPCLVIVDDVDSLPTEEQKMTLESAMQIGNARGRFLLTTRKNFTYSSKLCVEIGGLSKDEYADYVGTLCASLGLPRFRAKDLEDLRTASDGSPLFTESLVRLIRNGMKVPDAVKLWTGKMGQKVRQAALESEVKNLSPEGRRTLLAAVYLHECSLTELAQVTGYDVETLSPCIEELRALFLLSAPTIIAKEARFRVQNNTRLLVLQYQTTLVRDPTALRKAFERVRSGQPSVVKKGNQKLVGAAITQAAAFLREGNQDDAIATLEAALQLQRDHPDLLYTMAKAERAKAAPDLARVRRLLRKAYDFGERKAPFFDIWYFSELEADHPAGAIEVASFSIDDRIPERREWFLRRAHAKRLSAEMRQSFDAPGAMDDLAGCRDDLTEALGGGPHPDDDVVKDKLRSTYGDLWRLVRSGRGTTGDFVSGFDVAVRAIEDVQDTLLWAQRAAHSVGDLLDRFAHDAPVSQRQVNLVDQRITALQRMISGRKRASDDIRWAQLTSAVIGMKERLDALPRLSEDTTEGEVSKTLRASSRHEPFHFDVFLAHNSSDKPFVRVISTRLQEKGLRPWLDENEIPPGRWFQQVMQDAIHQTRTAAIFVGQHGLGQWQALELRSFIAQALEKKLPVIPVLLPGVRELPRQLDFLRQLNAVSFRSQDDDEALDRLVWGITGRRPSE